MSTSDKILVFIPAYRCALQIGRVLDQFSELAVVERFAEILVLDNVSPDNTPKAAIKKAKSLSTGRVTIARNLENYGLGGSHKSAFDYALTNGFSHILVLHGDDQGDIHDILPVLDAGLHQTNDCCLGARFHPCAQISGYSRIRIIGNHVYNAIFSMATGHKILDLGAGLNIYRVPPLASNFWFKFYDNLMFNYCMILAHVAREDSFVFFPISWREDDQVSNVQLVSQAWKTLWFVFEFVRRREACLARDFRSRAHSEYKFEILAERL